ncbi:hypothetical protein SARC_11018 [Sphaeroforma arctica JP610]|uniref:Uncharacterized protein n=1 Tax=Sphaeroforma arctica JP610 TaxID=667725 RepID=A0A0L0FI68_9EUKA|nr:hypothetical protein SARC_11018 [Sphaeroforma arctica JP610]KNC76482.1 hypothetical protein SARC_11018 [Sphaeroforma arctica JP610]|eukprot:XP_014150384.1 hypothetical protein SARC_11018 [Sphaeroforma arctica JP610]
MFLSTSVSSALSSAEDDSTRDHRKESNGEKSDTELVRMYTFCSRTRSGNMAAIFVNLNADKDVGVNLKTMSDTIDFDLVPRVEYMLTSTALSSLDIYLNDKLLSLTDTGALPDLKGRRVVPGYFDEQATVLLQPASYAIIDFEAELDLCKA